MYLLIHNTVMQDLHESFIAYVSFNLILYLIEIGK